LLRFIAGYYSNFNAKDSTLEKLLIIVAKQNRPDIFTQLLTCNSHNQILRHAIYSKKLLLDLIAFDCDPKYLAKVPHITSVTIVDIVFAMMFYNIEAMQWLLNNKKIQELEEATSFSRNRILGIIEKLKNYAELKGANILERLLQSRKDPFMVLREQGIMGRHMYLEH
jgi:hypothetical protein